MPSGLFIQTLNASTIRAHGMTIGVGEATLWALTRSLTVKDREFLPQGDDNAAATEMAVYSLIPTEMAQKGLPMLPGTVFTDLGMSFTVLAKPPPVREGTVPVEQIVIAYSTPRADAAVVSLDQSQDGIWTGREVNP